MFTIWFASVLAYNTLWLIISAIESDIKFYTNIYLKYGSLSVIAWIYSISGLIAGIILFVTGKLE